MPPIVPARDSATELPRARFASGTNPIVDNPPGGSKTCLNCKLATAEFSLERPGQPVRTLLARQRAAFEILTDRDDHGVAIVA